MSTVFDVTAFIDVSNGCCCFATAATAIAVAASAASFITLIDLNNYCNNREPPSDAAVIMQLYWSPVIPDAAVC